MFSEKYALAESDTIFSHDEKKWNISFICFWKNPNQGRMGHSTAAKSYASKGNGGGGMTRKCPLSSVEA